METLLSVVRAIAPLGLVAVFHFLAGMSWPDSAIFVILIIVSSVEQRLEKRGLL